MFLCFFVTSASLFAIGLGILCFFVVIFDCCSVVNTSIIDCLERFVPEMTWYLSSGTLDSSHNQYGIKNPVKLHNSQ